MKTIRLEEPGRLVADETPPPGPPGPGEVLVQVRRVGICGTDLHAYRGRQPFFSYPRILGHELGVTVVAVGEGVTQVALGDRCSVEPYLACGRCIACRRGRGNCCTDLQVLGVHVDGGMREQIVVPAAKLHCSETLTLEQLALVETLGIGAHAVARAAVDPGEPVLVIGAGPIGLGAIQFAMAAGGDVTLLDLDAERLEFARQHMGVRRTSSTPDDLGPDFTVVFDATGHAGSMNRAFDFVAPSGRLVFIGLHPGEVVFSDPLFHRREMTLLASRNALPDDFRRIIALMETGEIDTTPWITHRCEAAALPTVFPSWLDPRAHVLKAMVQFKTEGDSEGRSW